MQGVLVFNSSSEIINNNRQSVRVFIGLDGHRYGTRRASAAALALMSIPSRRATGYRDEVANG